MCDLLAPRDMHSAAAGFNAPWHLYLPDVLTAANGPTTALCQASMLDPQRCPCTMPQPQKSSVLGEPRDNTHRPADWLVPMRKKGALRRLPHHRDLTSLWAIIRDSARATAAEWLICDVSFRWSAESKKALRG